MTALTTNGSAAAATTLAAAGKLFNATGGTSGNTSTKVGSGTLFKQIFALGTATSQTGVASIPAPTDSNFHGWMWDVTTLEGQRLASGTITPTIHLLASTGTTVTPTVEWYKRSSGGVYTQIATVTGSSIALTTSSQALTFTAPTGTQTDFATGDKLVMWLWVNQTAGGATNSTISVVEATSGSSAGVTSEAQTVTPGYAPIPIALSVTMAGKGTLLGTPLSLVLYGSSVADTTLTTANKMASTSGGVETSALTTTAGGSGNWCEILPRGGTSTGVASIPTTPTGNGWVFAPGAGTFALGNWWASCTFSGAGFGASTTIQIRFSRYSGGVYTLIGSLPALGPSNAKTVLNFAATSMASITFGATDLLHVDAWINDTTGVAGDNPTVYESTTATAGVAGDVQVTTSAFTSSGGVTLSVTMAGTGVLTPALSANLPLPSVTLAGTGTLVAAYTYGQTAALYGYAYYAPTFYLSYATSLTTTLVGTGTLSGTLSTSGGGVALAGACNGVGAFTGTISLTTALSTTLAGHGTLSATPSPLTTALTAILPSVGTLSETFTLTTALTTTLSGVGTLSGTLSAALTMPSVTLVGTSTLSGTVTETTALAGTFAGTSTLSGTFQLATSLSTTVTGVGMLSGTAGLATSLTGTIRGLGVLTGVLGSTAPVALSGTLSGIGILSGSPVFTVFETGTLAGAGTLSLGGALQLATNLTASIPGTGHLTGVLAANVTLPGVTLAGVGMIAGTMAESTVLATSIPGVGVLVGTPTFALQLATVTMAGVGTIAGVESLGTVLTSTLAGVGTLTGAAPTFKTALTSTMAGVGQLSGILGGAGALVGTCVGAGTLSVTFTLATALSASTNGAGTLSGTLHEGTALAVTLVGSSQVSVQVQLQTALGASVNGMGTVAFTLFLGTTLTVSLSGTGTLTSTGLSERTNLALVFAASSSLTGHLIVPILSYLSATCVTRDMQATARTRDMTALAHTRDMQAAAKTRS